MVLRPPVFFIMFTLLLHVYNQKAGYTPTPHSINHSNSQTATLLPRMYLLLFLIFFSASATVATVRRGDGLIAAG